MRIDNENRAAVPSLLERQSRGGDIGEGGVTFQAEAVLAMVPAWLAEEGFTSLVRESIGDAEAKFFVPGVGYRKDLIESKDHTISPSEFWEELDRFSQIANGSGEEYRSFTLACTGLSSTLQPLAADLRRIIGPRKFYRGSSIFESSYQQFRDRVVGFGRSESDAILLFDRVSILDDLSMTSDKGRVLFRDSLTACFPSFGDLPERILNNIYSDLAIFLRDERNKTISRMDLERIIHNGLPDVSPLRIVSPIRINTLSKPGGQDEIRGPIFLDLSDFFGGQSRDYPPAEEWDGRLIGQLKETKQWILDNRNTRKLLLSGERRLSSALAIGSVFSAVSGFSIEMQHRDAAYATNAHANQSTPEYDLWIETVGRTQGERLVVAIGIVRKISEDVDAYLKACDLGDATRLLIEGATPIFSAEQANLIVGKIKSAISEALDRSKAKQIDLFIAAPSFLALFIGHRLNATAPVQCYEWLGPGNYVKTCKLPV